MNDEDEITDLRRKTVHGNGAAPIQGRAEAERLKDTDSLAMADELLSKLAV
jgi:hypothetical protein